MDLMNVILAHRINEKERLEKTKKSGRCSLKICEPNLKYICGSGKGQIILTFVTAGSLIREAWARSKIRL